MYHTLRSSSVGELGGRDAVPLDDLVSVIETLKARLETHRQVLEANETRTRMALIDPLLRALGWDTADPTLVLPEYDLSGKKPDYALLDAAGRPVALIEAKHLRRSLESHREQIVTYANLSGVPYAGLTDGNHWELYKVFDPAPIEDRLLLNVSIADRPAHELALKLLLLWRPNLAAGEPVEANEPVLTTVTESEVPRPETEPEVEEPPAAAPEQAPEPTPMGAGWVPLSEVEPASIKGKKTTPRTAIRLPDEKTRKVGRSWRNVLRPTVKWLWSNELLTISDIPVKGDKGAHVINTEGKTPSGQPFRYPYEIAGTPLVIEENLTSGHNAVDWTQKLLRKCGVSLADVQLHFGED